MGIICSYEQHTPDDQKEAEKQQRVSVCVC